MKNHQKIILLLISFISIFSPLQVLAQSSQTDAAAWGIISVIFFSIYCCIAMVFVLLPIAFIMISIGLTIWMVIDIFSRDFGDEQNIIVLWVILLIFTFPIGHILYYILVMQQYPKK
jgi:hypothetical protein